MLFFNSLHYFVGIILFNTAFSNWIGILYIRFLLSSVLIHDRVEWVQMVSILPAENVHPQVDAYKSGETQIFMLCMY